MAADRVTQAAGVGQHSPQSRRSVRIPGSGGVQLDGELAAPQPGAGVVVFAHGSGSSRRSARNQSVARALAQRGLGTLLMDLLTPAEEVQDARTAHLRFDIELLADRVVSSIDWLTASHDDAAPLGCFGASTGAAAALVAAAARPDAVGAVVSRGGRPDLAGRALGDVRAPTLLIVGGEDRQVIDLNEDALGALRNREGA